MPGGKKVLVMTHAVPVASGPIITSQHVIDLDTKESPVTVCKDGAYQQGLFNGDGSGIYLTEKMKDPDSPGNYKFKSRYFDLKKKELSDLPLSWDKSILDVGSDGQFALIHTLGDRSRPYDFDVVSTKDWKSIGKAHQYSNRARLSRDGRATLSTYRELSVQAPTLHRVPVSGKGSRFVQTAGGTVPQPSCICTGRETHPVLRVRVCRQEPDHARGENPHASPVHRQYRRK